MAISLSNPRASPPCGGHPKESASIRCVNLELSCSDIYFVSSVFECVCVEVVVVG